MKQITAAKNISVVELEQVLFTRTRTKNEINTTAVNALSLLLAANTVDSTKVNELRLKIASNVFAHADERKEILLSERKARTFSFTQVAEFIVNKLKITSAYHKKDNSKIAQELSLHDKTEILNDKRLNALCIKITALRLRNHTAHHITQTSVYHNYFSMATTYAETFTVEDDAISFIMNNAVRTHVIALTRALKAA